MILALDDEERGELLAELLAERFGTSIPWAETCVHPEPLPRRLVRVRDKKSACARRRQVLNTAMADPIDTVVTDMTTISIGASA